MKRKVSVLSLISSIILLASCGGQNKEDADQIKYESLSSVPSYRDLSSVDFSLYKTFYIDSIEGNDNYEGLDQNSPKKSISSIPDIITKYGETYPLRILLKKGCVFEGNIILGGYSATEDKPFILSSYGDDNAYPIVKGVYKGDLTTNAIITIQEQNTRVDGLEVTGSDCTRGIYVKTRTRGIFHNIVIKNCYVHDINWNWTYSTDPKDTDPATINVESVTPYTPNDGSTNRYRRLYGGIEVFNGTISGTDSRKIGPAVYDNLFIENNRIEHVSHVAINFYNYWTNRYGIGYGYNKYVPTNESLRNFETGLGFFPYTNIVVRNNYTDCIGGDSIILDGVENFYVTGNTSYRASYLGRSGCFNAGIWVHNAKNGYMTYNEAAYTCFKNGAGDGEGFDIDIACENIKVYYNYAHHNEGGGLLVCNNSSKVVTYDEDGNIADFGTEYSKGEWKNNYVKNNIFAFNGISSNSKRSAFITVARSCNDLVAENNTVVIGDIEKQHIINCEDNAVSYNHTYKNNIFYCISASAKPVISYSTIKDPVFDGNLYFNVAEGDELYSELSLKKDTHAATKNDFSLNLPSNYNGYEMAKSIYPNVTVKDVPILVKYQLAFDFLNNTTEKVNYLGAICK